MSGYRLSSGGSQIDRNRRIRFSFDGRDLGGFAGDTLASALLANEQILFGRSFKYHRPRGVLSAGAEEPSALVTMRGGARVEPNTKATMVELYDGLEASSQNRWPSLGFDVLSVNSLFSNFLSAGFYYKTFMGPTRKAWMVYEHFIRRAAGLGAGGFEADPDRYEGLHAHCDVLVVGSGPTGLMAARAAAVSGARVILAEEMAQFGGMLPNESETLDGVSAGDWAKATVAELSALDNVTLMPRTSVYGYFDDNVLAAVERVADHMPVPPENTPRQRHWTIRAKQVVIASGAIERPIVFDGNDTPGVMLSDAVRSYALRFGVAAGRKVIFFTNNDRAYHTALRLADQGMAIRAVVDARSTPPQALVEALAARGIEHFPGHVVAKAEGGKALEGVHIAPYDPHTKRLKGSSRWITTDALAVSGGWSPAIHLASHASGRPNFRDDIQAFVPGEAEQAWRAAGACNGDFGLAACLVAGAEAGAAAAGDAGFGATALPQPSVEGGEADDFAVLPLWEVPAIKGRGKKFVDLQHDVTAEDVRLAQREGFQSVEHLKRYTTLGMAADQGKTSNINGLAIMAETRGASIPEVGTTRFRPPYNPVSLGAIAGREIGAHFRPVRLTPMHDWHVAQGADMLAAGAWLRPRVYREPGESVTDAYIRETRAVRDSVGIVDVSTLGKIDVQGPDAAEFLNRVYSNGFAKLPVGKARYGLMLREDGIVYDDGTTWRLSEAQYLMTTTTANAAGVLTHLEHLLSIVWPELRVQVNSVTEQWAGMAVSGPNARRTLEAAVDDMDLSNEALPFMGVRPGHLGGIPVLIARLSFSGELAYEVYTEANYGLPVWEKVLEAGKSFGIIAYGTEALGALRIEKGHVAGPELDGRTTAADLGLGGMASRKKHYIGCMMLDREGLTDPSRLKLVGLVSLSGESIRPGSQLVEGATMATSGPSLGHVSSTTYSPALEKQVALGLVEGGLERSGHRLYATYPLKGHHVPVEVVEPVFFDKDGSRMHV